jgi:C4-dicarboxylate-specific signal transduction histidine kinase
MLRAAGVAGGYFWQDWLAQVLAGAAVTLVIVPPGLNRPSAALQRILAGTWLRQLEAALLLLVLLGIGALVLSGRSGPLQFAGLLAYAPLPLLFWTVIRFGPLGSECVFLLFAGMLVAGTAVGAGPFAVDASAASLLLSLFLSALAVPLLMLSASLQERRGTLAALCSEQARLGQQLLSERTRADVLARDGRACGEAEQRQRAQLVHLSRVVVLGELSGALAHELNQPLAAILTNAQAARRFLSRPGVNMGEIREILDDIVEEDKRAGEVIRRLRALFKKDEEVRRPVELAGLVREALDLSHACLVGRNIGVRLELDDGLVVHGDRVQLQQVLLNLIINACDAMHATQSDRRRLDLTCASAEGGVVWITVADSGPGIAQEAIGRVFDPFFTTKKEGLGFGLSISRTIINQHGGSIDVVNNPSGGCQFGISLPAYTGEYDE